MSGVRKKASKRGSSELSGEPTEFVGEPSTKKTKLAKVNKDTRAKLIKNFGGRGVYEIVEAPKDERWTEGNVLKVKLLDADGKDQVDYVSSEVLQELYPVPAAVYTAEKEYARAKKYMQTASEQLAHARVMASESCAAKMLELAKNQVEASSHSATH